MSNLHKNCPLTNGFGKSTNIHLKEWQIISATYAITNLKLTWTIRPRRCHLLPVRQNYFRVGQTEVCLHPALHTLCSVWPGENMRCNDLAKQSMFWHFQKPVKTKTLNCEIKEIYFEYFGTFGEKGIVKLDRGCFSWSNTRYSVLQIIVIRIPNTRSQSANLSGCLSRPADAS